MKLEFRPLGPASAQLKKYAIMLKAIVCFVFGHEIGGTFRRASCDRSRAAAVERFGRDRNVPDFDRDFGVRARRSSVVASSGSRHEPCCDFSIKHVRSAKYLPTLRWWCPGFCSFGKEKQPLPLWRHAIPARGDVVVCEQLPISPLIEPARFVRKLPQGVPVHRYAIVSFQMRNIERDGDDSIRINLRPRPPLQQRSLRPQFISARLLWI
jgi:hypothetical protein